MSSLRKNESIEIEVSPLPSGALLVKTRLVTTTPRVGRRVTAEFSSIRMPDFPYDAGSSYLAKRLRNACFGATTDPELE